MGYARAGFEVVGVDIIPQPHYPFGFHQGDALEFLREHGHMFDAIHASPPCQAYSETRKIQSNDHPELIPPTRMALQQIGLPWVIENVPGSPLIDPVELCGAMFGLRTYRHRLFETSFPVTIPPHPKHGAPQAKMGRPPREGEFIHVVGNFSGVEYAKTAMGIDWMNRNEMAQAIPPTYTEYIGCKLMEAVLKSQRWQDGKRKDKRMDWQQIETAPTDGTAVLVTNGRGVWIAKHKAIFQYGYNPDSPWFCLMLNKDHIPGKFRAGKPTHWMPLPEAPNAKVTGSPALSASPSGLPG